MKTKLELIILLAGMMSCLSARAQIDIAVNGVQILSKMTKDEVVAKFGEPDDYQYEDTGDNGINEWYWYGKSHFVFKDDCFIEFTVYDRRFVVTLPGLDAVVTVGNKFSVLEPLNPEVFDIYGKDYYNIYYLDETISVQIADRIITFITYSVSM